MAVAIIEAPRRTTSSALRRLFDFDEPGGVEDFLDAHPEVIDLLIGARPQLDAVFGSGTRVTLAITHDHEDGSDSLTAWIHTRLGADEALDLLERFNDYWWVKSASAKDDPPIFVFHYE